MRRGCCWGHVPLETSRRCLLASPYLWRFGRDPRQLWAWSCSMIALPSIACVFTEHSLPVQRRVSPLSERTSVFWIKGPPYASRTSSDLDSFCKDSFQIRSHSLEIRTLYLLGGYIQLESLYFDFSRLECWL